MLIINNQKLKKAEKLKNKFRFKEALEILDNFENLKDLTPQERFQYYFLKSLILIDLLASKEAMKYAELAHRESIKMQSDFNIIKILLLKSRISRTLVEQYKALEFLNKAEEILQMIRQKSSREFKSMKGQVLLRKGSHYFTVGELNRGIKFLGEASQIASEIKDEKLKLLTTKWLGFSYSVKGDSNRAFDYKQQYLKIAIKSNDKQEIIGAHNTLGIEFTEKGNFKEAIKHLEKSLALCYRINSWKTFIVGSSLFDTLIKSNSFQEARNLHNRMGELINKDNKNYFEQMYRSQEATLLKAILTEDSLSRAEKIFKEILDNEIQHVEIKFDALLNLCDIFLLRLRKTSNLNELDNLQLYIDKIRSLSENERIYSLLIEMYIFQAKIKLITFEFKQAQDQLALALEIAHKYGLNLLFRRVQNAKTELSRNFIKWEKLKFSGGKISERMDLAHLEQQIKTLLQKRNYFRTNIKNQ